MVYSLASKEGLAAQSYQVWSNSCTTLPQVCVPQLPFMDTSVGMRHLEQLALLDLLANWLVGLATVRDPTRSRDMIGRVGEYGMCCVVHSCLTELYRSLRVRERRVLPN